MWKLLSARKRYVPEREELVGALASPDVRERSVDAEGHNVEITAAYEIEQDVCPDASARDGEVKRKNVHDFAGNQQERRTIFSANENPR